MIRRLAVHALVLLALLLLAAPAMTPHGVFHADEGAVLAEVRALDEGTWTLANPQPELDPEAEALPLELSERFDDGRWAPYLKHPLYPAIVWFGGALGDIGWLVPGVLGTAVAALGAGILAERIRPSSGRWAIWAAGLATPLFFQSYVVQAHTLGAAAVAMTAVAADSFLGARGRRQVGSLVLVVVAAAVAVLLRTEALFAGVAVAIGLAVAGRFRAPALGGAAVLAVATAGVWRLEGSVLVEAVAGASSVGSLLAGRASIDNDDPLGAFRLTVLDASFGTRASATLGALGAVFSWGASLAVRAASTFLVRSLLIAAFAVYVVRTIEGGLVPGLAVTVPVFAGVVGLRRSDLQLPLVRLLAVASLVYAGAVVLTQYSNGGGATWGGRFFAVGLPLFVPLAVVGLANHGHRLHESDRRFCTAAVAGIVALLVVLSGSSMRKHRGEIDQIVSSMLDARTLDGGELAVLSTTGIAPRFAWEHVDDGTWLTTDPDDLERYLHRLVAVGEPIVLVSFEPDLDLGLVDDEFSVRRRYGPYVFVLDPR